MKTKVLKSISPAQCYFMMLLFVVLTACKKDTQEIGLSTNIGKDINGYIDQVSAANTSSHPSLALRWAPIHYQDVDVTGSHGLSGKADYITAINFPDLSAY
jgi:hypothetical protein